MCYLGNDIVDFSESETHKKFLDSRFLDRVYSRKERQAILASRNPDATLWALWAVKEAAYKACVKYKEDISFSPKSFALTGSNLEALSQLTLSDSFMGQFNWSDQIIKFTVTKIARQVIHAVAVLANHENIMWLTKIITKFQRIKPEASYQEQSNAVRSLLTRWIRFEGLAEDACVIRPIVKKSRRLGPPRLYSSNNELASFQVSLSHDGRWVGFAVIPELIS